MNLVPKVEFVLLGDFLEPLPLERDLLQFVSPSEFKLPLDHEAEKRGVRVSRKLAVKVAGQDTQIQAVVGVWKRRNTCLKKACSNKTSIKRAVP